MMKHNLINTLLILLLIFCNICHISGEQPESDNGPIKTKQTHSFQDKDSSTFEILTGDNDSNFSYKIIETTYKTAFLGLPAYDDWTHYFAKYTTTTSSCTECEGQERNIKIELRSFANPEHIVSTIEKNCDDIKLSYNTYETITYGCCGGENELEIFEYNHRSIIQADNEIVFGEIPNSKLKLYAGCRQPVNDPYCLSTLTIAYNRDDRYTIQIKSKKQADDTCSPFTPDIEILEKGKEKRLISNNKYQLWSLNGIMDKEQINGLVIKLTFNCDESITNNVIEIPLTGGKPFGSELREQIVYFDNE